MAKDGKSSGMGWSEFNKAGCPKEEAMAMRLGRDISLVVQ